MLAAAAREGGMRNWCRGGSAGGEMQVFGRGAEGEMGRGDGLGRRGP